VSLDWHYDWDNLCAMYGGNTHSLVQDYILPVTLCLVDTCMLTHIHTELTQVRSVLWPEINYKHICVTYFQGITDNIYNFWTPFLTSPPPFQWYIYPSKMAFPVQMTGGLHKVMATLLCMFFAYQTAWLCAEPKLSSLAHYKLPCLQRLQTCSTFNTW